MLDRMMLAISKPAVEAIADRLVRRGINADQVTLAGFAFGCLSAVMIAFGLTPWAVAPLLINRMLDGVDGAVARKTGASMRGAFLDITLDFLFYASVPLAFALCDPSANALPAAVLLAAFIGTGTSFLAFAIMAEKRGEKSTAYPSKSFYYLGGLAEGSETVLCFVAMCLWPQHFAVFAYVYAALCTITTITRIVAGWERFGDPPSL